MAQSQLCDLSTSSAAAALDHSDLLSNGKHLKGGGQKKTEDSQVQTEREGKRNSGSFTQTSVLDTSFRLGWDGGGEMKIGTQAKISLGGWVHRQTGAWFCFFESQLY